MGIVQELATHSQTELMEAFLLKWWPESFGKPPTGPAAIA